MEEHLSFFVGGFNNKLAYLLLTVTFQSDSINGCNKKHLERRYTRINFIYTRYNFEKYEFVVLLTVVNKLNVITPLIMAIFYYIIRKHMDNNYFKKGKTYGSTDDVIYNAIDGIIILHHQSNV
jgi:hypothetical protein